MLYLGIINKNCSSRVLSNASYPESAETTCLGICVINERTFQQLLAGKLEYIKLLSNNILLIRKGIIWEENQTGIQSVI